MTGAVSPRMGDFGLIRTNDTAGRVIRWATNSSVNHAFVYVGGGKIIEAQPGGAVISAAAKYGDIVWSTGRLPALTDVEREHVVRNAFDMVGVPYGWPDIVCIGLAQRRLGGLITDASPIARRISRQDRLICSQLVDLAWTRAGLHLFDDDRLPGLVSPGDLLAVLAKGGQIA